MGNILEICGGLQRPSLFRNCMDNIYGKLLFAWCIVMALGIAFFYGSEFESMRHAKYARQANAKLQNCNKLIVSKK